MKTLVQSIIGLAILALLMNCGGSKSVSTTDVSSLPPEERVSHLETQASKKPNDIAVKKQLYKEYLAAGQTARAMAVMEDILRIDKFQTDVLYEYGELNYKSGDQQRAYRAFLVILQGPSAELYKSRIATYVSAGADVRQLTSDPSDEGFPSFSPDGQKLIFQKKSGSSWDIVEFEISSSRSNVVLSTPADEELPVYSPISSQIAFTSTVEDRRPINAKYKVREISLADKGSSAAISNLTQSVSDDWLPRYSHDGAFLLFVSERNDLRRVSYADKQSDLFIMENNGDFQQQLTNTPANEGGPCFSADDQKIFFHSDRNGNYDIFVMKNDGTKVMTIIDERGNDVNPHASPDGAFITFVSDRSGNYEIYRARIDGTAQQQMTFSPAIDSNPVFSPDGQSIAFHSNRNGNFDIFLLELGGSAGPVTVDVLITQLNSLLN